MGTRGAIALLDLRYVAKKSLWDLASVACNKKCAHTRGRGSANLTATSGECAELTTDLTSLAFLSLTCEMDIALLPDPVQLSP